MYVQATTIDLQRAERVARAGAPYPYPSAAEARRAHQPAAAQAYRHYLIWSMLWGSLLGVLVILVVLVAMIWRSIPVMPFVGGGVATMLGAGAMLVPRWKSIGRHRAVFEAYGIPSSVYGQAEPDPEMLAAQHARAAEGMDLREEARRGLRIYRRVIGLNIVLVVAFWVVEAFAILPTDGNTAVLGWAALVVSLLGVALGCVLFMAMGRVRAASRGEYTRGKSSGIGVIVFIVALIAGGLVTSFAQDIVETGRIDLGGTDLFRAAGTLFMIVLVTGRWAQYTLRRMRTLRELGEAVHPQAA